MTSTDDFDDCFMINLLGNVVDGTDSCSTKFKMGQQKSAQEIQEPKQILG